MSWRQTIRQVAALPYRPEADGNIRVMLITSRETQRWVLPKGNLIKGLRAHEAAAQEAYEEAGVEGIACPTLIGSYTYAKRRKTGLMRTVAVDVFPFAVTGQADEWPEQDERTTAWFTLPNAAAAVDEPELKAIIAGFRDPLPTPGLTDRVPAMREEIGRKIPVLRWFQSLMPKQGRFFELFEAHSQTLVAGADALARLMQGGPDLHAHIREIVMQEDRADTIAREANVTPQIMVRSGKPTEIVGEVIRENDEIAALVLATAASGAPGPLVAYFTGQDAGTLPCPVMLVPGGIDISRLDALS